MFSGETQSSKRDTSETWTLWGGIEGGVLEVGRAADGWCDTSLENVLV